jgi:beta-glucosidase
MPGCSKNVDDLVKAVETGEEIDGYTITLADLQFCAGRVIDAVVKTTV